jgi:hypothetical protein
MMKKLMCFSKLSPKKAFTPFSIFLLMAGLTLGVFYGCQKNLDTSDPSVSNNPITTITNPLTVDMVQTWFQSNYGKTHTIKLSEDGGTLNGSLKSRSSSTNFVVTPIWDNAKIAAYLKNRQIVIVPVEKIEELNKPLVGYCAVFFRDSVGKIGYTLQMYASKANYYSTHSNLRVNDFSGIFLQIRPDGQVKSPLAIEDGKIVGTFNLTSTNQSNFDGFYIDWQAELDAILAYLHDSSGGGFVNRDPPYTGLNYGDIGVGAYDTGGGGGYNPNPQNPNPNPNPNYYLADEIGNEMFDMTDERVTLLYINNRLQLDVFQTQLLRNNRNAAVQIEDYLRNHNNVEADNNAKVHINLLMSDIDYFTANNGAGFPQIGTDAWINAVWTLGQGWGDLNEQEKQLAKQNPGEFIQYALASKDAFAETIKFTEEKLGQNKKNDAIGNDRNNINAFQHSYWNATLSVKIGTVRAKVWTDAHESGLPNNPNNSMASQMDFFNNYKGREVYDTWRSNPNLGVTLAELIKSWLNNGQMQFVCFDSFDQTKPIGYQYINQRLKFTNQTCP